MAKRINPDKLQTGDSRFKQKIVPGQPVPASSTMYRPSQEELTGGAYGEVAEALKEIAPSLMKYGRDKFDRDAEAEMKAGATWQMENKKGWRKALKDGDLDARSISPFWAIGALENQAINDAAAFEAKIEADLEEQYSKRTGISNQPTAYNDYLSDKRQEHIKEFGDESQIYVDTFYKQTSQNLAAKNKAHARKVQLLKEEDYAETVSTNISASYQAYTTKTNNLENLSTEELEVWAKDRKFKGTEDEIRKHYVEVQKENILKSLQDQIDKAYLEAPNIKIEENILTGIISNGIKDDPELMDYLLENLKSGTGKLIDTKKAQSLLNLNSKALDKRRREILKKNSTEVSDHNSFVNNYDGTEDDLVSLKEETIKLHKKGLITVEERDRTLEKLQSTRLKFQNEEEVKEVTNRITDLSYKVLKNQNNPIELSVNIGEIHNLIKNTDLPGNPDLEETIIVTIVEAYKNSDDPLAAHKALKTLGLNKDKVDRILNLSDKGLEDAARKLETEKFGDKSRKRTIDSWYRQDLEQAETDKFEAGVKANPDKYNELLSRIDADDFKSMEEFDQYLKDFDYIPELTKIKLRTEAFTNVLKVTKEKKITEWNSTFQNIARKLFQNPDDAEAVKEMQAHLNNTDNLPAGIDTEQVLLDTILELDSTRSADKARLIFKNFPSIDPNKIDTAVFLKEDKIERRRKQKEAEEREEQKRIERENYENMILKNENEWSQFIDGMHDLTPDEFLKKLSEFNNFEGKENVIPINVRVNMKSEYYRVHNIKQRKSEELQRKQDSIVKDVSKILNDPDGSYVSKGVKGLGVTEDEYNTVAVAYIKSAAEAAYPLFRQDEKGNQIPITDEETIKQIHAQRRAYEVNNLLKARIQNPDYVNMLSTAAYNAQSLGSNTSLNLTEAAYGIWKQYKNDLGASLNHTHLGITKEEFGFFKHIDDIISVSGSTNDAAIEQAAHAYRANTPIIQIIETSSDIAVATTEVMNNFTFWPVYEGDVGGNDEAYIRQYLTARVNALMSGSTNRIGLTEAISQAKKDIWSNHFQHGDNLIELAPELGSMDHGSINRVFDMQIEKYMEHIQKVKDSVDKEQRQLFIFGEPVDDASDLTWEYMDGAYRLFYKAADGGFVGVDLDAIDSLSGGDMKKAEDMHRLHTLTPHDIKRLYQGWLGRPLSEVGKVWKHITDMMGL